MAVRSFRLELEMRMERRVFLLATCMLALIGMIKRSAISPENTNFIVSACLGEIKNK